MMRCLLFALSCLWLGSLAAQKATPQSKKVRFFSVHQAGLLRGASGNAFLAQTVNGIQYGSWATGVGLGLDGYAVRSVPVFVQVQKQLPLLDRSFAVYLDGGRNLPRSDEEWDGFNWQDLGGLYLDGGLQYHWRTGKHSGPVFSLGYSEKRYSWQQQTDIWCISAPCPAYSSTWMYTNRRIVLKAGMRF